MFVAQGLRRGSAWKVQELKLLIIEDDLDQRELIRETLDSRFGEGTVTAVGRAADALACDLASFDLILSDYNLPDCSGLDLLAKIKALCDTPVILVTGENVGQIATTAIRAGATDYIVKIDDYLFTIPLMVEKNLAASQLRKEIRCIPARKAPRPSSVRATPVPAR